MYGWYAVWVCILRFEDIREDWADEKDRRTCWQGRSEDVAGDEANLNKKLEGDVNGRNTRCVDMVILFMVGDVRSESL